MKIIAVIPAFNEELAIAKVIKEIPRDLVSEIIVVNNNSNDNTVAVAQEAGAIVLTELKKGYGHACLLGIEKAKKLGAEIIVFLDGDYSDYPKQTIRLVKPILESNMQLVIGSRVLGNRQKGSLTPQQVFGNWLATKLSRLFYKAKYTDLGPFRAITVNALDAIEMKDKTYGWTIEMQLKIVRKKFAYCEVPVDYRRRIGVSKVSGTVKGTIMAGIKIIGAVFKYRF